MAGIGQQGSTGPTGATGSTGPEGPTGPTGATGMSKWEKHLQIRIMNSEMYSHQNRSQYK